MSVSGFGDRTCDVLFSGANLKFGGFKSVGFRSAGF